MWRPFFCVVEMCDSLDGNHTVCKSHGLPYSVVIMSDYQLGLFMVLTKF